MTGSNGSAGVPATPRGDTVTRPDGRVYRSRKVIAYPLSGEDGIVSSVLVLGTHDIERALRLAGPMAADYEFTAGNPVTGWWRDGYENGGPRWVEDDKRGRAGVWFSDTTEDRGGNP